MSGVERRGSLKDGRKRHWFYCDNFLFNLQISKYAKLVYLYLCRCAGDGDTCFPSFADICDKTGCSNGVVGEALRELERVPLITRTPRRTKTGRQTSTIYTILDVQPVEMDRVQPVDTKKKHLEPEEESQSQNLEKPRISKKPRSGAVPHTSGVFRGVVPDPEPPTAARRAPAPDPNQDRFDVFWSWIPKRISEGRGTKAAAWEMWNEGVAPSQAQANGMTRLLRRYLAEPLVGYDFHDQGEPLVRPTLLVRCCWEAWRRRVELAEVLLEEVPELKELV